MKEVEKVNGVTWDELEKLGVTYDDLERLGITWDDLESGAAREKLLRDEGHLPQEEDTPVV